VAGARPADRGDLTGSSEAVNALYAELRPHALTLVAGFGIPDALLRAPIAVSAQVGADSR